mmetsp:Transcript_11621/g.19321  ORF Transcript_11621/g.19321 Transcript_11621/m.19321 type:complete len:176 (+) Transcript_11621:609-1136(+)
MTDGLKPPTNEKCWGFGNRAVELQLLQPLCVDPKELKGKKFKMYVVGPDLCLASYANSVREVQGIDIHSPAYNKLTEETKDQMTDRMKGDLSDLLQNAELAEDFAAGCMDKDDPGISEEKGDCSDWSMEQVRTNGFMSLAHWEKVMQSDNGALWLKATKDISFGEEIFLAYDVVL